MHNLEELKVWVKSVDLSTEIYRITKVFPSEEKFGITQQMRRCSVSIASNIAEGAGRSSKKEFANFLSMAMGSCYELSTQLLISKNLGYVDDIVYQSTKTNVDEIKKMIFAFVKRLKS